MPLSSHISNERPAPDKVLTDIADYALNYEIQSDLAYATARACLIDTLGCGLEALEYPACTKLLGPIVPGTVVPFGARVPGTNHVDFSKDGLVPARARARATWIAQRVTVKALADAHLLGGGEPIAFDTTGAAPVQYAADGSALVGGTLHRDERYTVWSTPADPSPAALVRSPAAYPGPVVEREDTPTVRPGAFPVTGQVLPPSNDAAQPGSTEPPLG